MMVEQQVTALTSLEVRERLVEALKLDLIGPCAGHALAEEQLPGHIRPSNWYLAGFLIPAGSPPDESSDPDEDEDLEEVPDDVGLPEENAEERRAAKKAYFPSSMGLSFLVSFETDELKVSVTWGDYTTEPLEGSDGKELSVWQRHPREAVLSIPIPERETEVPVSGAGGLVLHVSARVVSSAALAGHIPVGTRAASVFLVNRRTPDAAKPDLAYVFQPEISVTSDTPLVPRPDPQGAVAADWDEQVADLQYADTPEYAVGHGVAAAWELVDGACHTVRTAWIPSAEVQYTETTDPEGVELSMVALGDLADGDSAKEALAPLVARYGNWIGEQRATLDSLSGVRRETAEQLLVAAEFAARRIEQGIDTLSGDADALDAFRVANRAVARALQQRALQRGEHLDDPRWRAFQLAFILLNVPGLVDPTEPTRETVDLLFFPTGGGKTEAYLGLAAFAMVLRRLRNPGEGGREGAGVTVIMRYTLRLLTLDQLSRAAGLVCALDLSRARPGTLWKWPFEIGLWVGKAATPNIMGRKGDKRSDTARIKTIHFKEDPQRKPSPIPLENCPWCGRRFDQDSFSLCNDKGQPETDNPTQLRVVCTNIDCDFTRDRALPIVAVDEHLDRACRRSSSPRWISSRHSVGGSERGTSGRGRSLRCLRLLRTGRTGQGRAPCGGTVTARPHRPGRAAPDIRPLGYHGRALRDGHRGSLHPEERRSDDQTQDRRLDGYRQAGPRPGAGSLRQSAHPGLSASGARSARLLFRSDKAVVGHSRPAVPGCGCPGAQP